MIPATVCVIYTTQKAYCKTTQKEEEIQTEILNLNTSFMKSSYVDPVSHVTFPPVLNRGQDLMDFNNSDSLNLISAGTRCMLADSMLCDRPITRVYSYGLYMEPSVFENQHMPDFDEVLFSSPDIVKTLYLHVTVTKNAGHWYGGFKKTLGRRFYKIPEFRDDVKARGKARQARKRWISQFINADLFPKQIPYGTIIAITWHQGKVITHFNGKKTSEIENDILGEALFRTYFGNDAVNPGVNQRTRDHYYHGMKEGEINHNEKLKSTGACPAYRKCGKRLTFTQAN